MAKTKTLLEKTRDMIQRRLSKIAVDYIAARYPEGIKDKRIYLSLTIIKEPEDESLHCSFNNEYLADLGDGTDVDFPLDYWWHVKVEE